MILSPRRTLYLSSKLNKRIQFDKSIMLSIYDGCIFVMSCIGYTVESAQKYSQINATFKWNKQDSQILPRYFYAPNFGNLIANKVTLVWVQLCSEKNWEQQYTFLLRKTVHYTYRTTKLVKCSCRKTARQKCH